VKRISPATERWVEPSGQSTLEYMLIVGALVLALAAVMVLGFPYILQQFIGFICPSVDTAVGTPPAPAQVGTCLFGGS
jgi:hypothetical protein